MASEHRTRAGLGPKPSDGALRTRRVAAYIRYSSRLQDDGYSLEAQRHGIECDSERWEREHLGEVWGPIAWYEEPAKSARAEKLAKRLRFLEMIRDVEAGVYDLVVFHKINRMARNLKDQLTFIARIADAGAGVHFVVERPDYSTTPGRLLANIMGSVAQYFTEDLGEEVKKGIDARARDGMQVNKIPFGYRSQGDPKLPPVPDIRVLEDGTPEKDEQGRPLGEWWGLQELIHLVLQGFTHEEVARKLKADGRWRLRSSYTDQYGNHPDGVFSRSSVSFIRSNVFYRPWRRDDTNGTIRHNGECHRGAHVAACTWEEWHAMQRLARGRRRGRGRYKTPSGGVGVAEFRGILVCADCAKRGSGRGHAYVRHSWSGQHTGEGIRYDHYYCEAERRGEECTAQGHFAKVEHVRAAWVAWMRENLQLPDIWQELLHARARAWARSGGHDDGAQVKAQGFAARRRHLEEKRDLIIDSYTDKVIDKAGRDRRLAEVDRKLLRLAAEEDAVKGGERTLARLIDAGRFVSELADDWPEMTPEERARAATLLLEPRGLVVRLLGHGYNLRVHGRSVLSSCELVEVRLRPVFRELMIEVCASEAEHEIA